MPGDIAPRSIPPVDERPNQPDVSHADRMTIASHCVDLLRANGPMTREELGESCRVARVTVAKDPARSVEGALAYDGRTLRIEDRYHLVERLLDGRWLTLDRPGDPRTFRPDLDLRCLDGPALKDGVPLASGGHLRRSSWGDGWTGPAGWAPPGEVIGIRLVAGVAHVSSVEVDDDMRQRGEQLVARLEERCAPGSYAGRGRLAVPEAVLRLLHEDDEVLRRPVPPLRWLFPADTSPYRAVGSGEGATVHVVLPPHVYDDLLEVADDAGVPVSTWVADELTRLHTWPHRLRVDQHGPYAEPWHHFEDDLDWRTSTVLRLDRPRR